MPNFKWPQKNRRYPFVLERSCWQTVAFAIKQSDCRVTCWCKVCRNNPSDGQTGTETGAFKSFGKFWLNLRGARLQSASFEFKTNSKFSITFWLKRFRCRIIRRLYLAKSIFTDIFRVRMMFSQIDLNDFSDWKQVFFLICLVRQNFRQTLWRDQKLSATTYMRNGLPVIEKLRCTLKFQLAMLLTSFESAISLSMIYSAVYSAIYSKLPVNHQKFQSVLLAGQRTTFLEPFDRQKVDKTASSHTKSTLLEQIRTDNAVSVRVFCGFCGAEPK